MTRPGRAPVVVVMGVSGSGKSTVGRLLADRLGVPFAEADDLHPVANRAKMAAGHPLDDRDRMPWLHALAGWLRQAEAAGGGVLACSALKRRYRDLFRRAAPDVWFLSLVLDEETADRRVAGRKGHFMPARLVGSQYRALEPLEPGEPGRTLDATAEPHALADEAAAALRPAPG